MLSIRAGRSRFTLQTLPESDFPDLAAGDGHVLGLLRALGQDGQGDVGALGAADLQDGLLDRPARCILAVDRKDGVAGL